MDERYLTCYGVAEGYHLDTYLPNDVLLEGEWEVGLVQATIPFTWTVARDHERKLTVKVSGGREWDIHLQNAPYTDIDQVLAFLNRRLAKTNTQPLLGFGTVREGRVFFVVPDNVRLELSEKLATMLGSQLGFLMGRTWAGSRPDMTAGQKYVYLAVDCVSPSLVGSVERRILRPFPLNVLDTEITHRFSRPYYKKLSKTSLNHISFTAFTEDGQLIRFNGGRYLMVLHFRKCAT